MYRVVKNTWISLVSECVEESESWILPALSLPACSVFRMMVFTVSLGWWSNSQIHTWLRLAETLGVHLVHTSAHVRPPRTSCPCPDGFWVSLKMETLQPPKQPVLHSHSKKNSFLTFIQKFLCSYLCHWLWTCQLWRVLEEQTKTSVLLSMSISLYVLTCMQIKSPGDAHYSWFPTWASLK